MMKINKYISLAALAVAFSACQDDTLGESKQQDGIYTLSGEVSGGKAMSRAQIQLGNTNGNQETFMWNEGDAFTLFQKGSEQWAQRVFTISKDYKESGSGDKKTAVFTTTSPAVVGDYVAFYPANLPMEGSNLVKFNLQQTLDFSGNANPNEVWSNYLQDNMFMMATGTLSGTGVNTVSFQHMMSLARITYTNETGSDQSITQIGLGGNIYYVPEPYIDLTDSEYRLGSSWSTTSFDLITNGLTVAAGETFDFYILFTPVNFENGSNFDINLNHGTSFKTVSLPTSTIAAANNGYLGFEAGKRYWFKITELKDELVFNKDYVETVTIENVELSAALYDVLGAENVKLENDFAVMTKAFAESVETIEIPSRQYTITSLSGIEYFINLKELSCPSTGLTECNLSKNTKLESVAVWGNSLTTLDLSNQPSLLDINCAQNYTLQTLKINENARLTHLIIDDTQLQSISIPNPGTIQQLAYSRTPLNLDLTQFASLRTLYCSGNNLATIELTTNQKAQLENLECDSNSLTSLNLSEYPNLRNLSCWRNLMETLDITPLKNLQNLECGNQQNGIELQLQLTSDQYNQWVSTWSKRNGDRVRTSYDPTVEPDSGNTNGNDFWFEEL